MSTGGGYAQTNPDLSLLVSIASPSLTSDWSRTAHRIGVVVSADNLVRLQS
jgi:hypothetical protein